jgi:hypothetical protein
VRERETVRHGAVEEVQVGSANSAECYADLDVARTGFDRQTRADSDGLVAFKKSRLHGII